MATQAQSQGRYAVINTFLDTTDVTLIDSLSGRQGDNGRIVYFAIKDGNLPHNFAISIFDCDTPRTRPASR